MVALGISWRTQPRTWLWPSMMTVVVWWPPTMAGSAGFPADVSTCPSH